MAIANVDSFIKIFKFYQDNPLLQVRENFKDNALKYEDTVDVYLNSLTFDRNNSLAYDTDEDTIQTALNAREKVAVYFDKVLYPGSYSFNTVDNSSFRKMLLDWTSTIKTIQDSAKKVTDAYSLSSDDVDKAIRGFGADFVNQYSLKSVNKRKNFLLNLCDLYSIKGSPESITKALSVIGLSNIFIREGWIESIDDNTDLDIRWKAQESDQVFDSDNDAWEKSESIDDTVRTWDWFIEKIQGVNLDPHWFYSKEDILKLNNSKDTYIKLPSITPYFGIEFETDADSQIDGYDILQAELNSQLQKYLAGNLSDSDKTIWFSDYQSKISILECYTALVYSLIRLDDHLLYCNFKSYLESCGFTPPEMTYPSEYFQLIYWFYLNYKDKNSFSQILNDYIPIKSSDYCNYEQLLKWWLTAQYNSTDYNVIRVKAINQLTTTISRLDLTNLANTWNFTNFFSCRINNDVLHHFNNSDDADTYINTATDADSITYLDKYSENNTVPKITALTAVGNWNFNNPMMLSLSGSQTKEIKEYYTKQSVLDFISEVATGDIITQVKNSVVNEVCDSNRATIIISQLADDIIEFENGVLQPTKQITVDLTVGDEFYLTKTKNDALTIVKNSTDSVISESHVINVQYIQPYRITDEVDGKSVTIFNNAIHLGWKQDYPYGRFSVEEYTKSYGWVEVLSNQMSNDTEMSVIVDTDHADNKDENINNFRIVLYHTCNNIPDIFFETPFNLNSYPSDTLLDRVVRYNGVSTSLSFYDDDPIRDVFSNQNIQNENNSLSVVSGYHKYQANIINEYHENQVQNFDVRPTDIQSDLFSYYGSCFNYPNHTRLYEDKWMNINSSFYDYVSWSNKLYFDTITHNGLLENNNNIEYSDGCYKTRKYPINCLWNWAADSKYYYICYEKNKWCRVKIDSFVEGSPSDIFDGKVNDNISYGSVFEKTTVGGGTQIYIYVSYNKFAIITNLETDWTAIDCDITNDGHIKPGSKLSRDLALGLIKDETILSLITSDFTLLSGDDVRASAVNTLNSSAIIVYKQPYDSDSIATQYNYQSLLSYLYNSRLTLDYKTGYIYPKYSYYKDTMDRLYIKCKSDSTTTDTKWLRVKCDVNWNTLDSDCHTIFDIDNEVIIKETNCLEENPEQVTKSYTIEQATKKLTSEQYGKVIMFKGQINEDISKQLEITADETTGLLKALIDHHAEGQHPTDEWWIQVNSVNYQFDDQDDAVSKIKQFANMKYYITHNGSVNQEYSRSDAISFVKAKNNGFLYPKYSFIDRYTSYNFLNGPVFETHNHLIEAFNNGEIDDDITQVLVFPYSKYADKITNAYENYVKIAASDDRTEEAVAKAEWQALKQYEETDEQYQNIYPVIYVKYPVVTSDCLPGYEWKISTENRFNGTNLGINPEFVKYLENKFDQDEQNLADIPTDLTECLSEYLSETLGVENSVSDLTIANWTTNGLVKKVINFFKPKRARLLFMSNVIEGEYGITNNLDDIMICDSDFNYYDLANYRWNNPKFTTNEYGYQNRTRINQVIEDYVPSEDTIFSKPPVFNEISNEREIYNRTDEIPELELYDKLLQLKNQVLDTNDTSESKVVASFYVSGFELDDTMNGFYFKLPGKEIYSNNSYYFEQVVFSILSGDNRLGATTRWALFNSKITSADRTNALYVAGTESDYPWRMTNTPDKMKYSLVHSDHSYINKDPYEYVDVGISDDDIIKVNRRTLKPSVYFNNFEDERCNGYYYQDSDFHADRNDHPVYFNQKGKIISYITVTDQNVTDNNTIDTETTQTNLWIISDNKCIVDFIDADYWTVDTANNSGIWDNINTDYTKSFFRNEFYVDDITSKKYNFIKTIKRYNELKKLSSSVNYGYSISYLENNPQTIRNIDRINHITTDKYNLYKKSSFNQIELQNNPICYYCFENGKAQKYYVTESNSDTLNISATTISGSATTVNYVRDQECCNQSAIQLNTDQKFTINVTTNSAKWTCSIVCKFGDATTISRFAYKNDYLNTLINKWINITFVNDSDKLYVYINGIKSETSYDSVNSIDLIKSNSANNAVSEVAFWEYNLEDDYIDIISKFRILRNRPQVTRDKNYTSPNNYRPLFVTQQPRIVYNRWDRGVAENVTGGRYIGYNADTAGITYHDINPLWDNYNYTAESILPTYETGKKITQSVMVTNGIISDQETRFPVNDGSQEITSSDYLAGIKVASWWLRNDADYRTGAIHHQPIYISVQEKIDDIYPLIKNGDDIEGNYFDRNRFFDGYRNRDNSVIRGTIEEQDVASKFYDNVDYDESTKFKITTNEKYPEDRFTSDIEWPTQKPSNWIWSKNITETINFQGDGITNAIPTNEIADTTQQIPEPTQLTQNWAQNSLNYCKSVYPYHVYVNKETGNIINPFSMIMSERQVLSNPGSTFIDEYNKRSNIVPDLEQYNLNEEDFLNGIFHKELYLNSANDYSEFAGTWRSKDSVESYKDGDFKKCYVLTTQLEVEDISPTLSNVEALTLTQFPTIENIDPYQAVKSEAVLNYHKENGLYWWEIRKFENNIWITALRTYVKPEFNHNRQMINYDLTNRNQLDLCGQKLCVASENDIENFKDYNWPNVTQNTLSIGFSCGNWITFNLENDDVKTEATSNFFDGRYYHILGKGGIWKKTKAEMIYPEHVYDGKEEGIPPPEVAEISNVSGTYEELTTLIPNIIDKSNPSEVTEEDVDKVRLYEVVSKFNELSATMNYFTHATYPVTKLDPDEATIYDIAVNQNIIIDHHSDDFESGKTVSRISSPDDATQYDVTFTMFCIMWAIGSKATISAEEIFITELLDVTYLRLVKDLVFKFGKSTPSGFLYRDDYLYVSLGKTPDFSMEGMSRVTENMYRYNQQAPNKWIRIPVSIASDSMKLPYEQWKINKVSNDLVAVMNVLDSTNIDDFEMSIIDPETISLIETEIKLQKFNGLSDYNSLNHMGEDVNYPESVNNDVSKTEISVKDSFNMKVYQYDVDNSYGTYRKWKKVEGTAVLIKFTTNETESGWTNVGGSNKFSKRVLTNIKKYGRI